MRRHFQVRLKGESLRLLPWRHERVRYKGSSIELWCDWFGARVGFREHSREDTEILFVDLGYKFSDQVENRFYLTLDRTIGICQAVWTKFRNGRRSLAG